MSNFDVTLFKEYIYAEGGPDINLGASHESCAHPSRYIHFFFITEDTWETWMPDPVDADPTKLSHPRKRSSDIISMLVNIYGSKELFVNEYRTLLSNRILSQFTYDAEREIRNLELLKLRFGEAPLHQCEVMLKGMFLLFRILGFRLRIRSE